MTGLILPVGGLDVNVHATVEKGKHPAGEKSFIPYGMSGYATFGHGARTEFRYDSCNTEHR